MLSSTGEERIHNILEELNIPYEEEYIFDDLVSSSGKHLRFDFAIFNDDGELDCLIEFNGIQHYKAVSKFGGRKGLYQQQYNDNLKRKYCLKHRIKLITIPYYEEDILTCDYILKLISGF